jgi:hypothetical protein
MTYPFVRLSLPFGNLALIDPLFNPLVNDCLRKVEVVFDMRSVCIRYLTVVESIDLSENCINALMQYLEPRPKIAPLGGRLERGLNY